MINDKSEGERVAWLTSCRTVRSHIHRTLDGAQTICGHKWNEHDWLLEQLPNHRRGGYSNYCTVCFNGIRKKSRIPWFEGCRPHRVDEEIKRNEQFLFALQLLK